MFQARYTLCGLKPGRLLGRTKSERKSMKKILFAAVVAATALAAAAPAAMAQPYGYGYHHFHHRFGGGPYGRGPYGYGWRHHWHPRPCCYRHPGAC